MKKPTKTKPSRWFKTPQYGLSIAILDEFMSKKELTDLLERYMTAKRNRILKRFDL